MIVTNRLKFVDMMGNESGSFVDNNEKLSGPLLCLGFGSVGVVDVDPGLIGGSAAESSICGMNDIADDGEFREFAVVDNSDGLRVRVEGECGGEGLGMEVIILAAGLMSWWGWCVFSSRCCCWSGKPRRRVEPSGISM